MRKAQALSHWASLEPGLPLKPYPIGYKHSGSTYGADGVRIEGTPEFVDAVLSRLQDLMAAENGKTRLALSYGEVTEREDKPSAFVGNVVCYIKSHERGPQSQAMNARFGV